MIYSLHEEPLKKQEVDWKQGVRANTLSVFHYTNSGLKFQKLHVPKGKVTFTSHTDPTQVATARLVIVLLNRMDGTGDQDNSQMETDITVRPTKVTPPVKVDHLHLYI